MDPKPDDSVVRCLDGKYRWVYEMSLFRNATIPLLLIKVFLIIVAIAAAIVLLISLASGDSIYEILDGVAFTVGAILVIFIPLGIVGYLIYAWMMGGKYCVLFEMDEEGILHAQQDAQVKKASVMSDIAILAGLLAGNPTTVGTGLLAKTNTSMYTEFTDVRHLSSARGRNVIYVGRNQVYVKDEDFDFVWDFIRTHCVNAESNPRRSQNQHRTARRAARSRKRIYE